MTKPKRPLLVVVTETEYQIPAVLGGRPNLRELFLALMIKNLGGVNESVTPGTYDFDVQRKGLSYVISLEPSVYTL